MEKEDYDKVLEIYDNHIGQTLKDSHSMLSKRDATSLLYRLEMEGSMDFSREGRHSNKIL